MTNVVSILQGGSTCHTVNTHLLFTRAHASSFCCLSVTFEHLVDVILAMQDEVRGKAVFFIVLAAGTRPVPIIASADHELTGCLNAV